MVEDELEVEAPAEKNTVPGSDSGQMRQEAGNQSPADSAPASTDVGGGTSDAAEYQNAPNSAKQHPDFSNVVSLEAIHNIKVTVQAVLGGVSMPVSKLMSLKKDDVVALDKKVGSVIDVLANGQVIARGEIVVLEEDQPRFGVTITEVVSGKAGSAGNN